MAGQLPRGAGIVVADLGCGPGVSTFEIARLRPSARLLGLDIAGRMLAFARRRAVGLGLQHRILWVRGDAARLPLPASCLDAVTGHSFLYLLADRAGALREIRRVLRPGGCLLLMEPSARPATLRQVLASGRDPRHLLSVLLWRPFSRLHGRYTPASLRATLEGAGFVGCQVEEVLGGLGLLARAERPAANG